MSGRSDSNTYQLLLAGLLAAASVMLAGCASLVLPIALNLTPIAAGLTLRAQVDCHGEHRLDIDTRQALAVAPPAPRLVSRVDPEYPIHAAWADVKEGSVKARLTLDRQGSVQRVELIESVPSHVFDREARRVLGMWTYSADRCADGRTVEATLEFKR